MVNLVLRNSNSVGVIDDADMEHISKYVWGCDKMGYIFAKTPYARKTFLHRFLLNTKAGMVVDHINRNPLDNRRCNLRECNQSQNVGNRSFSKNNTSGFKGVSFLKGLGKWAARIGIGNQRKHLGYYTTPEQAASVYDKAAIERWGEFAATNGMAVSRRIPITRFSTKRQWVRTPGEIPLDIGRVALVSIEDWERIDKIGWHFRKDNGYVCCGGYNGQERYLHRFVMDCPKGLVVDHINGDKLDNRRENLRVCTYQENSFNRRNLARTNTTGFTGVCKRRHRFQAHYTAGSKVTVVGMYATAEEAARARDTALKAIAGEFLNPNIEGAAPMASNLRQRTSIYRGVTKVQGRWTARIFDNKIKYLGRFATELGAHEAYQAAKKAMAVGQ